MQAKRSNNKATHNANKHNAHCGQQETEGEMRAEGSRQGAGLPDGQGRQQSEPCSCPLGASGKRCIWQALDAVAPAPAPAPAAVPSPFPAPIAAPFVAVNRNVHLFFIQSYFMRKRRKSKTITERGIIKEKVRKKRKKREHV